MDLDQSAHAKGLISEGPDQNAQVVDLLPLSAYARRHVFAWYSLQRTNASKYVYI